MSEITKLRQRMTNVGKHVTEYRMTVSEAKSLLKEIGELQKQQEKPSEVAVNEPTVITRIIDGGAF